MKMNNKMIEKPIQPSKTTRKRKEKTLMKTIKNQVKFPTNKTTLNNQNNNNSKNSNKNNKNNKNRDKTKPQVSS